MVTKRVEKPWGWELWLEQNERYCYKRIFIKAGTRTSFQYHEHKLETNYIISGEAEIWLEDDNGEIVKTVMGAGDFFTVVPPKKHRVVALTDVTLQECSTPEVDDVIRIQDDTSREGGKIESEHINPALCILAAGKGTRLDYLSQKVNKGLLPVNDKAIISHIIDLTPEELEIVIALGYRGNLIKEYCTAYYPKRKFKFVEVDKTEGKGTGPGYSLSKCKESLQKPFYFITADCIVDSFPALNENWLGIARTGIPELYSTVDIDNDNNVKQILNKSVQGFDQAFIGFAGIKDYKTFWKELESNMKDSGEVVSAFYNFSSYKDFKAIPLNWSDVGTIDGYLKIRDNQHSLPKNTGECLYKKQGECPSCGKSTEGKCIKLFPQNIENKKIRIEHLKALLPNVECPGDHIISYDWVPGKTLYEVDEVDTYIKFFDWAATNLWIPTLSTYDNSLEELCHKFYKEKTYDRYKQYKAQTKQKERSIVNDKACASMDEYLDNIDWKGLVGVSTNMYHGDLQFDNVIYNQDISEFTLIDWRDDFGGSPEIGDVHYDLAKLYGGMLINYRLMRDASNVHVFYEKDSVLIQHTRTPNLDHVRNYFESWVKTLGYDLKIVKTLTGLIFLNMSPLHEETFSEFLFYKAKELFYDINK